VQGVEQGLLKGRRLGRAGGIGTVLAGAIEVGLVAAKRSGTIEVTSILSAWPFVVSGFVLALSLGLLNWSRLWLKESREPFRFTFSVDAFEPLPESKATDPKLRWLQSDLRDLLAERIGRLQRLDGGASSIAPGDDAAGGDAGGEFPRHSHIHVSGSYVVREPNLENRRVQIEVSPWVRIGSARRASRLARGVSYRTATPGAEQASRQPTNLRPATRQPEAAEDDSILTLNDYQRVLDRVYFSVASEIYDQIRRNVERKIALLPNDRFRAVAYFCEAEDFARSNTLDAYETARQLYAEAIARSDPGWNPLASGAARRALQRVRRGIAEGLGRLRLGCSWVWPRLARKSMLLSRAEMGYANMLLYRRALATLSGQRVNPVFEARPVASRAMERLRRTPDTVPRRRETLFEAFITLGLTWTFLRSRRRAEAFLAEARDLCPLLADQDPRYLFAAGMAETRVLSKLPLLRRSVELHPQFEVARFHLALTSERLWRSRPRLEPAVARDFVCQYYEEVVKINPGNVSAWSHLGYVHWLMGETEAARAAYENGLQYKDVKDDTYVAELEYGLARILAEDASSAPHRGLTAAAWEERRLARFEEAFQHGRLGMIEEVSQGHAYQANGYSRYFFEGISFAMLRRYWRYKRRTVRALAELDTDRLPARMRDAVEAFVRSEFAEACWNFYLRTWDHRFLLRARSEYQIAIRLDPEAAIPRYNQYAVLRELGERASLEDPQSSVPKDFLDEGYECIKKAHELEPTWLDANIALALERARREERLDRKLFERLLPHGWLWTSGESHEPQLDWKAFRAKRLRRDLTWEREFDDVHVLSLFAFAQALAAKEPPKPKRFSRSTLAAEPTAAQAAELLVHIQRHFYPDDIELMRILAKIESHPEWEPRAAPWHRDTLRTTATLWIMDDSVTYRALKGRAKALARKSSQDRAKDLDALIAKLWKYPYRAKRIGRTLSRTDRSRARWGSSPTELRTRVAPVCSREAMRRAVNDWLANEPQPYWALEALCSGVWCVRGTVASLFTPNERRKRLLEISRQPLRSPVLLMWVGDRLRDLGEEDEARSVYTTANVRTLDKQIRGDLQQRIDKLASRPLAQGP
jgi:hypothetical protein